MNWDLLILRNRFDIADDTSMYFPTRGKVPKAARGRRIPVFDSPAPDPRVLEHVALRKPRRGV